jgi:hypothetical protein
MCSPESENLSPRKIDFFFGKFYHHFMLKTTGTWSDFIASFMHIYFLYDLTSTIKKEYIPCPLKVK